MTTRANYYDTRPETTPTAPSAVEALISVWPPAMQYNGTKTYHLTREKEAALKTAMTQDDRQGFPASFGDYSWNGAGDTVRYSYDGRYWLMQVTPKAR